MGRRLGLEVMSMVNRDTYEVFILVFQSQSFSFENLHLS